MNALRTISNFVLIVPHFVPQQIFRNHRNSFCFAYVVLALKVTVAIDLHYMNHLGQRFQLQVFFAVTEEEEKTSASWMD